jgi:hypothetical protein
MDRKPAEPERFSLVARLLLGASSGLALAWAVTVLVTEALFAAGGRTPEAVVELTPAQAWLISGGGVLAGVALAAAVGRTRLPWWLRGAALGALWGVGVVVLLTLAVAHSAGGSTSMVQAPYLHAGLAYGVPVGAVVGAAWGVLAGLRRPRQ